MAKREYIAESILYLWSHHGLSDTETLSQLHQLGYEVDLTPDVVSIEAYDRLGHRYVELTC